MKTTLIAASIVLASAGANATNGNNVQQQIDDLKAGLHQVHMNTLQKYSESWGLEDRSNIAALQKDQKRQDDHINAVQGAAQSANEKADGLAVRADGIEKQAGVLDGRVGAVEVRADKLEDSQREQNAKMDSDRQQRVDGDAANAKAITTEAQARAEANVKLAAGVAVAQSTGDYAKSRADQAYGNAQVNSAAIRKTNQQVAQNTKQLANHEQRLDNLQQQTNRNFASLGQRIEKVQDKANAGTATALAAAGIPQVTGEQRFSLGAAVGGYESEQALAVGFSSRITDNVVIKASVATDTQHGVGYNLGTSIGW